MRRCVYDIEADNLLVKASVVHCIVIHDLDTDQVFSYRPGGIEEGYKKLQEYDVCVGHNVLGFDKPCLEKLYAAKLGPLPAHDDTFIRSRLLWGPKDSPAGNHGLEAWGIFFGYNKIQFNDWSKFSEEMLTYCQRDVYINVLLHQYLTKEWDTKLDAAYLTESRVRSIVTRQELNGFRLDPELHRQLLRDLDVALAEARDKIDAIIPPEVKIMQDPEYWLARQDTLMGVRSGTFKTKKAAKDAGFKDKEIKPGPRRTKTLRFNPGSSQQIVGYFQTKYGWEPTILTEAGNPSMTAEILDNLAFEEADLFAEYQLLTKRISQVDSWSKFVVNGRVHGSVNTVGAATYRMTHSDPNIAQVTAANKKWGAECRACWTASPGRVLVGTDAKGLELRMLANALAPYDKGAYIPVVCDGDPHEYNNQLAGLGNRTVAKTCVYAFVYGGGLIKLGKISKDSESVSEEAKEVDLPKAYVRFLKEEGLYQKDNIDAAKRGLVIRDRFKKRVTGFGDLLDSLTEEMEKNQGWIKGIDGRRIPVDSGHKILNRRFQSDGAIVMKVALVEHYRAMYKAFGPHGKHWAYCANVHDEFQVEVEKGLEEEARVIGCDSIKRAGTILGMACPLAGDSKSGETWLATH